MRIFITFKIREEANKWKGNIEWSKWKQDLGKLSDWAETSLHTEARKYKSAEEFAKNKLTAYHWGDKVINELDDRKIFFFVWDNAESFSKKFWSQTTRADISNLNVLKEWTKEYDSFIKNNMWRNIEPHLKYSKQNLSNLWYDAIEREWQYIWSKEIVVYNPSKIKTEAQLRKIREEANKKWLKKAK